MRGEMLAPGESRKADPHPVCAPPRLTNQIASRLLPREYEWRLQKSSSHAGPLRSFPKAARCLERLTNNEVSCRPSRLPSSASVNQHSKVSSLCPRKRMWLFFRGSRRRIKIRCAQEKVMGLGVDLHRLGPILGRDRIDFTEFFG